MYLKDFASVPWKNSANPQDVLAKKEEFLNAP
jgi:hypothetical protein